MQKYKHINMVGGKLQRYNELKYRGKKVLNYVIKYENFTSEQLNKDTKNINLYFSLLGAFCLGGGGILS